MNCKKWDELTVIEKVNITGKAIHLLQQDDKSFEAISSMIRHAENKGLFDKVTFLPDTPLDII